MTDLPHSYLIAGDRIILPSLDRDNLEDFAVQRRRRKSYHRAVSMNDEVFITGSINAITLSDRVRRAGIIPYTISDSGHIVFAFGIDVSGDYSDAGGGFSKKYDKLPILAAVREFTEEFLGIVDVTVADLASEPCIVYDNVAIFFAYYSPEKLFSLPARFFKHLSEYNSQTKKSSEMSGIKLIFENDIFNVLESGNIYCVISQLLHRNLKHVISILRENSIYKF